MPVDQFDGLLKLKSVRRLLSALNQKDKLELLQSMAGGGDRGVALMSKLLKFSTMKEVAKAHSSSLVHVAVETGSRQVLDFLSRNELCDKLSAQNDYDQYKQAVEQGQCKTMASLVLEKPLVRVSASANFDKLMELARECSDADNVITMLDTHQVKHPDLHAFVNEHVKHR